MKKYLIVKKKNRYYIYDTYSDDFLYNDIQFKVYKDEKVYKFRKYEVVDDYFFDIGAITHTETEKWYCGLLVFESNDIEETAREFCHLERIGFEMYDKAKKTY